MGRDCVILSSSGVGGKPQAVNGRTATSRRGSNSAGQAKGQTGTKSAHAGVLPARQSRLAVRPACSPGSAWGMGLGVLLPFTGTGSLQVSTGVSPPHMAWGRLWHKGHTCLQGPEEGRTQVGVVGTRKMRVKEQTKPVPKRPTAACSIIFLLHIWRLKENKEGRQWCRVVQAVKVTNKMTS